MEPKTEPRSERILVSITPSMKRQLKQMAEEEVRSLSQMAYILLAEALEEEDERPNSSEHI